MQADGNAVLFTRQGSNFVLYTPEAFTGLTFSNVPVVAYGLNGSIVGGTVGGTDSGLLNGSVTLAGGIVGNGTAIAGSIADASGNTVNFNANESAGSWNRKSSLATVAGTYSGSFAVGGTTYSPSLTFDSAGKITGSDSGGCTYGGSVTTPDTAHNDYAVSFTSSCLSGSTFTGIGAYFPAGLLGILNHASFKAGLSDGSSTGIFLDLSQ